MAESYNTNLLNVAENYLGSLLKPVINTSLKQQLNDTESNNKEDKNSAPAKQSIAINEKQDAHETPHALDDWYLPEKRDYEVFAAKYPLDGEIKGQEWQVDAMRKWCDDAGITNTPPFLLMTNGCLKNISR